MQKITIQVVMAAALGLSALSGIAQAAEPFDGKKFFDELSSRGWASTNKIDGKKFFDELSSRGWSAPANFDGKKFWEEQGRQGGYNMPPMVEMPK